MTGAFEPFVVEKKTFSSFLVNFQGQIPDLQRPFAWKKEQATDLVRDILALVDELAKPERRSDPQHFIGTIVTISSHQRSKVIDGQQRLTTVCLLIGLLKKALQDISNELTAKKILDDHDHTLLTRVGGLIQDCNGLLFFTGYDKKEPRLLPSPEIKQTFLSFLDGGDGKIDGESSEPAKNLRSIADILDKDLIREKRRFAKVETLNRVNHLHRIFDASSKALIFVGVDTASANTGFQLFESLNATGEPLNALNLLKVWMMARLESSSQAADVAEKFRQLTSSDQKLALGFVNDYYRARTFSNIGNVSPKELSLKIRAQLFRDPDVPEGVRSVDSKVEGLQDRIIEHVFQMSDWLPVWQKLRSGNYPYKAPTAFDQERLQLLIKDPLKHTLPIPLLLQASAHLEPDQFAKFVHLLERVFFRYKTICAGSVTKLENVYQSLTRKIDTHHALDLTAVEADLQSLLDNDASDEVFEAQLDQKLIYSPSNAGRIRYFLSTLDLYDAKPMARIALTDVKYTIEHIAPRNPHHVSEVSPELIDTMGNLCLLSGQENSSYGNKAYADKRRASGNGANSWSALTRRVFMKSETWSDDAVKERRDELVKRAKEVFRAKI